LFFNIWFYQNKVFSYQSLPYYLATLLTIMILIIFFFIAVNALPVMISEKLKLKELYKKSYKITIFNFIPTLFLVFVTVTFLFFSKMPVKFLSMLSVIPFIFFFPVWLGQYLYESYICVLEKFGHRRQYIEKRTPKDFLFPWRVSKD
ncbi:MAG TPA: hypothetical protein VKS21_00420, partial [Spirochaetota bacterium]|nr:hypothetical protein [Spirochaetota bacterium]